MITDQEILDGCRKKGNKNPSQRDVEAFRAFMIAFECEDVEIYEEADEKISTSLHDLLNEIESLPEPLAHMRYAQRLAKLPRLS